MEGGQDPTELYDLDTVVGNGYVYTHTLSLSLSLSSFLVFEHRMDEWMNG